MADDVTVKGGLYDITFRNALAAPDDAVTGDKPNIMNMALARGCWFQYEYGVQIDLQTDQLVADVNELDQMQALYADMSNWTPTLVQDPTQESDALNQLFQWSSGSVLTDQASSASLTGTSGTFDWPALTSLRITTPNASINTAIGTWENVSQNPNLSDPSRYPTNAIFQTTDGIFFRSDGTQFIQMARTDIHLNFTPPLVASSDQLASARREFQTAIEAKTQLNQEKQATLQDLTASLQRWFSFTTNVNERKKRDADSIVGNFH